MTIEGSPVVAALFFSLAFTAAVYGLWWFVCWLDRGIVEAAFRR